MALADLRRIAPPRKARRGPRAGEGRWALLFLAPTLVGLALLSAGPIVAAFGISLTKWDLLTAPQFVGLDNFVALFRDPRFLIALRNTAFYTFISVPLGMLLSLGLAVALNQALRGIALIRTAYFLPVVTSATAVGLVWAWIYSPGDGILNQIIGVFGFPAQKWVSDPFWAMPSIIVMSVWQGLGTSVIVACVGLPGRASTYTWSNTWNAPMSARIPLKKMAGVSSGSVTRRNRDQRPAPSTDAAS